MPIIKCPECSRVMRTDRTETTHDAKRNSYDATFYRCTHDNVWVTIEIPKEEKNK